MAQWNNVGRIKGERGPEGPQGPRGERGPEGPRGPQGISGSDNIVESESNETSGYIRYDNGVQIVWGKETFDDVSFSDNNIVPRSDNSYSAQFIKPFYYPPTVIVDDTLGNTWCSTSAVAGSGTEFIIRFFSATGNSADTITVDYFAIGRWQQ